MSKELELSEVEKFFKSKCGNELKASDSWVLRFAEDYAESKVWKLEAKNKEQHDELLFTSISLLPKIERDFLELEAKNKELEAKLKETYEKGWDDGAKVASNDIGSRI